MIGHIKKYIVWLLILLFLSSCMNNELEEQPLPSGNPTPEDFLEKENADIFVLDGIVFSNAANLDWVTEEQYQLGEEIGEIIKQTQVAEEFGEGTSTKLPVGTKIYETDSQIYIAIVGEERIPYLKMIEG